MFMFKKKTLNNDTDVLFYCKYEKKKYCPYYTCDHHYLIFLENIYIKFGPYYIKKYYIMYVI